MPILPLTEDAYLSIRITGPIQPDDACFVTVIATDTNVSNDVVEMFRVAGGHPQGLTVWIAQVVANYLLRRELYQFHSWLRSFDSLVRLKGAP